MDSKNFVQISLPNGQLKLINIHEIALLEQTDTGTRITMKTKNADGVNAEFHTSMPYINLSVMVNTKDQ